jgi:hypothetical protein
MFLTTPENLLKPSSSASLPARFFPPFSVFLLPIYQQRRNFTQSDSLFILNSFLLNVNNVALHVSMTSALLSPALGAPGVTEGGRHRRPQQVVGD